MWGFPRVDEGILRAEVMYCARQMLLLEWWYRVFGMMSSPAEPAQGVLIVRREQLQAG